MISAADGINRRHSWRGFVAPPPPVPPALLPEGCLCGWVTGTQYLSDPVTKQIKFRGIHPSYSFVAEPQGNAVVERFNRTLKEQVIHGRLYRNLDELRDAVRQFGGQYNAQWRVEKNSFLSPNHAGEPWNAATSVRPAA